MPQGINISLNISKPCYHGFAIHPLLSVLLNNLIALQGTRVLEDREIRRPLIYVTGGAPQRQVVSSVIKYTGTLSIPQWMDIEQGSVLGFQHLCEGHSRQEQTSSRYCAMFGQTSLLLRIKQGKESQAGRTISGPMIWYCLSASQNSKRKSPGSTL
jgi:hypothetical protein